LNADRKAVFTFEEVEAIKQGYEAQISQLQQRVQKLKEENECLQLEFDELKKIIDNEKKNLTKELENILEAAEKPDNTANELASLRKLLRRSRYHSIVIRYLIC
jgi:regulator of replication initiation timing